MIILVGFGASLLVFLVFFWLFSNAAPSLKKQDMIVAQLNANHKNFTISSKDIEMIAGEDVLTTQLDLARAYIETDRKGLARNILNNVLQQGSADQKFEAQRLLSSLPNLAS